MKCYSLLCCCMILFSIGSNAQNPILDPLSVRVGVGASAVRLGDAYEPERTSNGSYGSYYVGIGPEVGLSYNLTKRVVIDLLVSPFGRTGTEKTYYGFKSDWKLRGYVVPMTINFLCRPEDKRFNVGVGLGVQFMHAQLRKNIVERYSGNKAVYDKIQPLVRANFQYQLNDAIYTAVAVHSTISSKTGYKEYGALSLGYRFKH